MREPVAFVESFRDQLLTTEYVLAEVGNSLAVPHKRSDFMNLLQRLRDNPNVSIVEGSHALFQRGVELFANRPDKEWSLTDCTSFVVMEEHNVRDALTADHHFQQAGFVALLA